MLFTVEWQSCFRSQQAIFLHPMTVKTPGIYTKIWHYIFTKAIWSALNYTF